MPKYTFECDCGLRFDRMLKMDDHPTFSCPSCQEEAPRLFTGGGGFGINFLAPTSVNGTTPTNTGVHDLDYPSADKVVGRSAESRWSTYNDRNSIKEKVRRNTGVAQLARRDGEGFTEYSSMSPGQRVARKQLVQLATDLKVRPRGQ